MPFPYPKCPELKVLKITRLLSENRQPKINVASSAVINAEMLC